jgi:hypothetical protein
VVVGDVDFRQSQTACSCASQECSSSDWKFVSWPGARAAPPRGG